jgi:hypothetical protein
MVGRHFRASAGKRRIADLTIVRSSDMIEAQ